MQEGQPGRQRRRLSQPLPLECCWGCELSMSPQTCLLLSGGGEQKRDMRDKGRKRENKQLEPRCGHAGHSRLCGRAGAEGDSGPRGPSSCHSGCSLSLVRKVLPSPTSPPPCITGEASGIAFHSLLCTHTCSLSRYVLSSDWRPASRCTPRSRGELNSQALPPTDLVLRSNQ